MGGDRSGGPGWVRRPTRGQTLPAWPYLIFFAVSPPLRWLHVNNRKDHRGGRSSGRRSGFLSIRCHRIIYEIDNNSKPAQRAVRGAPLASVVRH